MIDIPFLHDKPRLNWLSLSFKGDVERDFREAYFNGSLRQVRIALLLGIFLYGIFGILDFWIAPEAKKQLWFIRYIIFTPYILFVYIFSFSRHFKKYMQLLIAFGVALAGYCIVAMIVVAPKQAGYTYYTGLLLVFIYGYSFVRLRFWWATVAAWSIVLSYEFSAIWLSPTPIPILINNNFFFLSANLMCMFVCYSSEYYLRQNFKQACSLEAEKKKVIESNSVLEKRVRERTLQLEKSNQVLKKEIVKRARAQELLRQSEEKYRLLFDNAKTAIFISQDQMVKFPNPMAIEMFGISADELHAFSFLDFIHPDDQSIVFGGKGQNLNGDLPKTYTFRIIDKNNKILWAELNTVQISWEGYPATLNFMKDITVQKELADQLQRAKKMEAIGTLAGGVAHDLNNILSGIVSYPDLLLLDIDEDSPLHKPLVTIRESGQKASTIVQDLLTLARRGVFVTEPVKLNEIIDQYLKSPENQNILKYHPNVRIETDLDENLLHILGSKVHLSKVIMNLVSNASEAMPDGGCIEISTKNQYIERPKAEYNAIKGGDYIVFTISDEGVGLTPTEIDHIFEPFYSKKELGRSGTGLGMAVVWGTIKDHKGYIDVSSKVGSGTTFTLYFPATRQELAVNTELIPIEEFTGDGESILVVDDVKEQREIACGILKKLGYRVSSATGGEEAIAFIKEYKVDLMLLDMIMKPGIDGLETYKRAKKIQPDLLTIIASGYAETNRIRKAQKLGAGEYIKKPYTLSIIGQAIKNELSKIATVMN